MAEKPDADIPSPVLTGQHFPASKITYLSEEMRACRDVSVNAIKRHIRASDEAFGGGFAQLRHGANGRRHTRNVLLRWICFWRRPLLQGRVDLDLGMA